MLVAIIIVIKIKSHFCHKLLISAWKRGRFQFLPAEEVEFVSVGSSLVRGNHMGCIPSPFICTRVYPAGAGTELQDKPCTSVCLSFLCGCEAVFRLSSCPEEPCVPFPASCHSFWEELELCLPWQSPASGSSPSPIQTRLLTPHKCGLVVPWMQLSCSRCKSTVCWVGMPVWLCAGVAKPYFPLSPE